MAKAARTLLSGALLYSGPKAVQLIILLFEMDGKRHSPYPVSAGVHLLSGVHATSAKFWAFIPDGGNLPRYRRATMRVFGLVLASLLTTTGASGSAYAQGYYGGSDSKYQHELRKEQRECAKELREAKNGSEYSKAQRECRQEIAKVHREYRSDWRKHRRDWNDDRRWDRQGDDDDHGDD